MSEGGGAVFGLGVAHEQPVLFGDGAGPDQVFPKVVIASYVAIWSLRGNLVAAQRLSVIAQPGRGSNAIRTVRVKIRGQRGTMQALLDGCFAGLNIADFQSGKNDRNDAWPVVTARASDVAAQPDQLEAAGGTGEGLTGPERSGGCARRKPRAKAALNLRFGGSRLRIVTVGDFSFGENDGADDGQNEHPNGEAEGQFVADLE